MTEDLATLITFVCFFFKDCHANCTTEELGNGDSKVVNYKVGWGRDFPAGAEDPSISNLGRFHMPHGS